GAAEAGGRAARRAGGGGRDRRTDAAPWRARRRDPERRKRRPQSGLRVARGRLTRACIVAAAIVASVAAQRPEPGSPRARAPLTILQINDVYSTSPIDGVGRAGARRELEAAARPGGPDAASGAGR